MSRVGSAVDAVVGLALWPGIVAHEYAHVLACRATGVVVVGSTYSSPFGEVHVDHEPVESFPADLAIALAPFLTNTLLAVAALSAATASQWLPAVVGWYWLGICFGLTALPSSQDTATLFDTAGSLSPTWRRLAYVVAAPLRGASVVNEFGGVLTAAWLLTLLSTVGRSGGVI